MLNISRGYLRDLKAEIKKLAALSKELKAKLASTSSTRLHKIEGPKVAVRPTKHGVNETQNLFRGGRAERQDIKIYPIVDILAPEMGWTEYVPDDLFIREKTVDRSDWNRSDYDREMKVMSDKLIVEALKHWKAQQK
jgi:hypothetical protein